MNAVVIGLGSMGKRRIRLLKNNFSDITVIGIDKSKDRMEFCKNEYGIQTFDSLSDVLNAHEARCAFICTAPLQHADIIHECLEKGLHVFTELNLVTDRYEENIKLAKDKGITLFLSSTAMYRKEVQYIIDKVNNSNGKINYIYHVGQYLPDWHPWESYKDFFVSDKRTNGCREIMAIEFPWIIAAFGKVKKLKSISSKITGLNINYDDCYMLQMEHENGSHGSIIIDLVCREAVRKLEVFGEELYIEWQGKPDTLKAKDLINSELSAIRLYKEIDKLEGYSSTIIENQYLDEIKAFFNEIEGKKEAKYTFKDDMYTLGLIDQIEGKV